MSVLWWWLPTVIVAVAAWWRLRPSDRAARDKELRRLQRVVGGDR